MTHVCINLDSTESVNNEKVSFIPNMVNNMSTYKLSKSFHVLFKRDNYKRAPDLKNMLPVSGLMVVMSYHFDTIREIEYQNISRTTRAETRLEAFLRDHVSSHLGTEVVVLSFVY